MELSDLYVALQVGHKFFQNPEVASVFPNYLFILNILWNLFIFEIFETEYSVVLTYEFIKLEVRVTLSFR